MIYKNCGLYACIVLFSFSWDSFPHDHARMRAYRWGEDGLMGICDRQCRLCFALALWNGHDSILKERLFGLTGSEGNHGEDVKECYYYLDSTPTHSYMKALYKYPQCEYPYGKLVEENRKRSVLEPEFELEDAGVFDEGRYWDVFTEYAKASPNDILIKITVHNRGPDEATLHLLPTLWYRNTWVWGCEHEGCTMKPMMTETSDSTVRCRHQSLGISHFFIDKDPDGKQPPLLWTENETNTKQLWGYDNYTPYVKDAFHHYLVQKEEGAISPKKKGTKVAPYFELKVPSGGSKTVKMRLTSDDEKPTGNAFGASFDTIFEQRIEEADDFYAKILPSKLPEEYDMVGRQAYAGLLWSKQFYHYIVEAWLRGDPTRPPPKERWHGRNAEEWKHLFNRDVISMPDKWEYPRVSTYNLCSKLT